MLSAAPTPTTNAKNMRLDTRYRPLRPNPRDPKKRMLPVAQRAVAGGHHFHSLGTRIRRVARSRVPSCAAFLTKDALLKTIYDHVCATRGGVPACRAVLQFVP